MDLKQLSNAVITGNASEYGGADRSCLGGRHWAGDDRQ